MNSSQKKISFKTFGNSMSPFFLNGDIVTIQKTAFSKIRINDFVTFKQKKIFITHRVIYATPSSQQNPYLITKGDNNPLPDKKIREKNILGKVIQIKRSGKEINIENLYLFQSSFYFQEIFKINAELKKAEIDFVFLKGLPLHILYEGTHPRRIYADCDLLVKKNHFSKSIAVFMQKGYTPAVTSLSGIHKFFKKTYKVINFYKLVGGFKVTFDVHYEVNFGLSQFSNLSSLYPQRLLDSLTEKFINEKRIIRFNGRNLAILNASNLVIFLGLHLFHHNFKGYHRYQIFVKVLKKPLNYLVTKKTITEYKLGNYIYPVFLILKNYYFINVPSGFLNKFKPKDNCLFYIKNNILKTDIFEHEPRIKSGIVRFKHMFYLSPNPFIVKAGTFFNIEITYSILWATIKRYSMLRL